ncbi:unnamed protein product [Amoebophrya sp. A120]|nr:unnamed protein product [Amoebophrya sp. A120]|eukprot:GSA120T00009460001.1
MYTGTRNCDSQHDVVYNLALSSRASMLQRRQSLFKHYITTTFLERNMGGCFPTALGGTGWGGGGAQTWTEVVYGAEPRQCLESKRNSSCEFYFNDKKEDKLSDDLSELLREIYPGLHKVFQERIFKTTGSSELDDLPPGGRNNDSTSHQRLVYTPAIGDWQRDFPGSWMLQFVPALPFNAELRQQIFLVPQLTSEQENSLSEEEKQKLQRQKQQNNACTFFTYAFGPLPFLNLDNIKEARMVVNANQKFLGLAFDDYGKFVKQFDVLDLDLTDKGFEKMEIVNEDFEEELKKNPSEVPKLKQSSKLKMVFPCTKTILDANDEDEDDFIKSFKFHFTFLGRFSPHLIPFGNVFYKGKIAVAPRSKGAQLLEEQQKIGCALGSVLSGMLHTRSFQTELFLSDRGWQLKVFPGRDSKSPDRAGEQQQQEQNLQTNNSSKHSHSIFVWPLLFFPIDVVKKLPLYDGGTSYLRGTARPELATEEDLAPDEFDEEILETNIYTQLSSLECRKEEGFVPSCYSMRDSFRFAGNNSEQTLSEIATTAGAAEHEQLETLLSTTPTPFASTPEQQAVFLQDNYGNYRIFSKVQESSLNFIRVDFQLLEVKDSGIATGADMEEISGEDASTTSPNRRNSSGGSSLDHPNKDVLAPPPPQQPEMIELFTFEGFPMPNPCSKLVEIAPPAEQDLYDDHLLAGAGAPNSTNLTQSLPIAGGGSPTGPRPTSPSGRPGLSNLDAKIAQDQRAKIGQTKNLVDQNKKNFELNQRMQQQFMQADMEMSKSPQSSPGSRRRLNRLSSMGMGGRSRSMLGFGLSPTSGSGPVSPAMEKKQVEQAKPVIQELVKDLTLQITKQVMETLEKDEMQEKLLRYEPDNIERFHESVMREKNRLIQLEEKRKERIRLKHGVDDLDFSAVGKTYDHKGLDKFFLEEEDETVKPTKLNASAAMGQSAGSAGLGLVEKSETMIRHQERIQRKEKAKKQRLLEEEEERDQMLARLAKKQVLATE